MNVTFVLDPSAHAFEDKVLDAVNTLARTRRLDYAVRLAS